MTKIMLLIFTTTLANANPFLVSRARRPAQVSSDMHIVVEFADRVTRYQVEPTGPNSWRLTLITGDGRHGSIDMDLKDYNFLQSKFAKADSLPGPQKCPRESIQFSVGQKVIQGCMMGRDQRSRFMVQTINLLATMF